MKCYGNPISYPLANARCVWCFSFLSRLLAGLGKIVPVLGNLLLGLILPVLVRLNPIHTDIHMDI